MPNSKTLGDIILREPPSRASESMMQLLPLEYVGTTTDVGALFNSGDLRENAKAFCDIFPDCPILLYAMWRARTVRATFKANKGYKLSVVFTPHDEAS